MCSGTLAASAFLFLQASSDMVAPIPAVSSGGIFTSQIPFDVFVTIVLQRSVTRLPLSDVRIRGENRRVAITGRTYVMTYAMRSSSQSRPVINFH